MKQNRDHADEEVKGFERFIPNSFTNKLLMAIPTSAVATYYLAPKAIAILGITSFTEREVTLIATISSLLVALFVSFFLALNLMYMISKFKHGRVRHYSNEHPHMSFRWLKSNASAKHWIFLATIFITGLILGYVLFRNI